jgi:hypothetical protein
VGRIFLLSPARLGGLRAQLLLRPQASFPLAVELRMRGLAIGDAMEFMSGLYFRGKLAYARRFAQPPGGLGGAFVITPAAGLLDAETRVTADDLRALGAVDIDERDARYRAPLERDTRLLVERAGDAELVLLGSIASKKYVTVLESVLAERLLFPPAFIGRGDMSRGGLLLRCVRAGEELPYAAVRGAVRRGPRPPRLPRLPRSPR